MSGSSRNSQLEEKLKKSLCFLLQYKRICQGNKELTVHADWKLQVCTQIVQMPKCVQLTCWTGGTYGKIKKKKTISQVGQHNVAYSVIAPLRGLH